MFCYFRRAVRNMPPPSRASSAGTKRVIPDEGAVSPPAVKRRQQSTTTNKAVASFFTPMSKREAEKISWRTIKDSLLVGTCNQSSSQGALEVANKRRVAAFDLDSTLIATASGNRFGRDAADWKWWHKDVSSTLKALASEGYMVVILSNQGGVTLKPDPKKVKNDQKRLSDFKGKVSAVMAQLDLPISIYAATARDEYRKPRIGMWSAFLHDHHLTQANIDLGGSFFVGDAGGRPGSQGSSKDHSCVDRDFASNVGIAFHTPEEYFLKQEVSPFTRDFDPSTYIKAAFTTTGDGVTAESPTTLKVVKAHPLEIVIFCGSPGAGKSTFYTRQMEPLGYERVNQDKLKTRERCLSKATELLEQGKSIAVDSTNADPETRAHWIKLANKFNIPIRCILFTASAKLCEHNDAVRALSSNTIMNPEDRKLLPKVAFTSYLSRYRKPKETEGFAEIVEVEFEFEGGQEELAVWSQYWV